MAPSIPKQLVYLGEAIEVDGTEREWTWKLSDKAVVASDPKGSRLFIFYRKPAKAIPNPTCSTGMRIQTYMFDRDRFTQTKAKQWLKKKGAKIPKVDVQANYLHFRQEPKGHFRFFRVGELAPGIKVTYGCPYKKWARYDNPSKADDLYERFNRKKPTRDDALHVPEPRVRCGRAHHIVYKSDKFGPGKSYIHVFKHSPVVWTDNPKKPKILVLQGGKICVTRRGIEG